MSEEKVKSLISFEITKILWNNEWIKSSSEVDRNISIPKNVPELDEPKEVKDVKKKAIVKKEPIKAKKTVIEETKKEAPKAHKKTTDQVEKKVQDTSLHGILEQIKKQQRSSNLQESLKKYKTLVQKIEKEHSEIHTITNKISQIFKKIERYEANDLLKQYPDQIFRDIKSIINLI
jgi:polyribonucleotide nucleotidyltransferase